MKSLTKKMAKVTGLYLRSIRSASKISKRSFAESIDISVYHLNKIESGELSELPERVFGRIAEAIGCTVPELAIRIGNAFVRKYPNELQAEEKALIKTFGSIYKRLRIEKKI